MTKLPTRALLFLLCLALATPLAMAEDTPSAPAKAPDATDPKAGEPKAPKADPRVPVVKLIGNGSEPRVELRYTPTANTTAEFKTEAVVDIDSPMFKAKIGPIKATVAVKYAKTEKGKTPLDVEITHSEMVDDGSNPMVAQMKPRVDGLKGSKLAGSSSDCGVFTAGPTEGEPSATAATMAAQMSGLMPGLPKEAVGVGASWSVTSQIAVNGVKQTSVVTFTITKIDGAVVHADVKMTRKARDVTMMMQGQAMPIKSVDGEGSGTVVIDTEMGGSKSSSTKITTKMVMDMMGNEMTTSSTETSSIKGAPAAATTESAKPAPKQPETAKPDAAK